MNSVIFEKDNALERLKMSHEEIESLKNQLAHFREVQIQLQTFDDDEDEEGMQIN